MWNSGDSDDEVFFGKLCLKEVKKSISLISEQCQTFCSTDIKTASEDENNRSIKIIETHSTPNIRTSVCFSNVESSNLKCSSDVCFSDSITSACDKETDNTYSTMSVINANEIASHMEPLSYQNVANDCLLSNSYTLKPDDSFLQIEKLVNNEELDNTLDVIECILNNGSIKDSDIKQAESQSHVEGLSHFESEHAMETDVLKTQSALKTPIKSDQFVYTMKSSERKLRTPNPKNATFKTPSIPVSHKKMLTPHKKQFEHVVSPVASYINNSPIVPLLKNVRPKKELHGTSFIPQPIKNPSKTNLGNKENKNLPSTAYRSAKETKVIDIPNEYKLPQGQWAKHVASSVQKGVVMRHIHRENSTTKKPHLQQQEDSFSNLTLHQADLSVCTQKTAVKKAL